MGKLRTETVDLLAPSDRCRKELRLHVQEAEPGAPAAQDARSLGAHGVPKWDKVSRWGGSLDGEGPPCWVGLSLRRGP